jgi:hypothetical protein
MNHSAQPKMHMFKEMAKRKESHIGQQQEAAPKHTQAPLGSSLLLGTSYTLGI